MKRIFRQRGFSTLSCRCENDEFELVLVKSSRPTSSSVCSKNIIFSIFGKIFKYFPVNFGIKIIAIKFPFLWYYLQHYWSTISVLKWSLNFILVHKSSLVYRLQSRFLSEATAEFQLKSNLNLFTKMDWNVLLWKALRPQVMSKSVRVNLKFS